MLAALPLFAIATQARAGDLTVSAAISLSNAFKDVAKAFQTAHPRDHIVLNLAASDVLLTQIEHGAPADIYASADETAMDKAAAAHLIDPDTRRNFATNGLVLIVATGSRKPPSLHALTDNTVRRIAIGNPDSVPAGRYARDALKAAGLWQAVQPKLVFAHNVRQALDYVARGETETGFVYATDAALLHGKVQVALTIPVDPPVRYPIAVVATSRHKPLAREFEHFLGTPTATTILHRYGFGSPD